MSRLVERCRRLWSTIDGWGTLARSCWTVAAILALITIASR